MPFCSRAPATTAATTTSTGALVDFYAKPTLTPTVVHVVIRDDDIRDELTMLGKSMVPEGTGLILRSSCEGAGIEEIEADIAAMVDLAAQVAADADGQPELLVDGPDAHLSAWRDWPKPDLLADGDAVAGARRQPPRRGRPAGPRAHRH